MFQVTNFDILAAHELRLPMTTALDTTGARVQRKITRRLIPFLFLLYITAYLDRVNISFAGLEMTRELKFSGEVFGFGAGICGRGGVFSIRRSTSSELSGSLSAGFLGVPLTPSILGGTDYAFGGAWATKAQPLGTMNSHAQISKWSRSW